MSAAETSSKPLISIITVVLNARDSLERTMRSVFEQDYPQIEYIVIDGGSSDGTTELIRSHENRISYWESESDRGIAHAFNKGIAKATGQWVGLLNAGDWLKPDALEQVAQASKKGQVLHGDLHFRLSNNAIQRVSGHHRGLNREMTINHPTVFVARDVYGQHGTFDETYRCAMDYDLMLRFFQAGVVFHHIPEVLVSMEAGGMSDSNWRLGCREVRSIKDRQLGHVLQNRLWYWKQVASITAVRLLERLTGSASYKMRQRTRVAETNTTSR